MLPDVIGQRRTAMLQALGAAARGETPERGPRGGVIWPARYNALRSDIIPVRAIGARAVYIPYAETWVHEATVAEALPDGIVELAHIGLLPAWLDSNS